MKRVVVISTSLRKGSNSDMLADKFVEGAKAAGNDVVEDADVAAVVEDDVTRLGIDLFVACGQ